MDVFNRIFGVFVKLLLEYFYLANFPLILQVSFPVTAGVCVCEATGTWKQSATDAPTYRSLHDAQFHLTLFTIDRHEHHSSDSAWPDEPQPHVLDLIPSIILGVDG